MPSFVKKSKAILSQIAEERAQAKIDQATDRVEHNRIVIIFYNDSRSKQLVDWRARGQHRMWAAGVVVVVDGGVDAQVAVHRGQHVGGVLGIVFGFAALVIGGTDNAAAPDA